MPEEAGNPPERRLFVHGCELSVRVRGRGPPVVLVHGLTANGWIWHAVADSLMASHRVVVPDLAGRGASPPPPGGDYRLETERARLAGVLGELGLRSPLVVGHSQGAALAVALAARGPPLRGLVLVNPVTPWTARPRVLELLGLPGTGAALAVLVPALRRRVTRWVLRHRVFTGTGRVPPDAVERFAAPYAARARARALAALLADWNPGALARYFPPPSAPPGRVLAGARDARIRPGHAARLAGGIGAPFRVLAGAGHAIPLERPRAVSEAVAGVERERGYGPAVSG